MAAFLIFALLVVFATISYAFIDIRPMAESASGYHSSGASVQLFEWSWADIATECENFLGPKGYKAIQVSPPMEHILGSQWWTRYQPVSYILTSRSGDESQFKDMITRCKNVGVAIIVDAVFNHMAAGSSGTGTAGSKYTTRTFPMYSPNDFNHYANNQYANCQVTDYTNKDNVQYCDLVGLPDLATYSTYVQQTVASYLNHLLDLGVSGIRVDAAKHQDATELKGILSRIKDSRFYIGQEVIGAQGEAVQPNMYFGNGQVSEFYYSDYLCSNIINSGKMKYLSTFGESWGLMPDQYAVSFIDNHDTQRNGRAMLTYKNADLYTFATMFMLAWPYGNARVMSSYYFTNTDQGPPSVGPSNGKYCSDGTNWVCEHRFGAIANMVKWRNLAGTAGVDNWQQGNDNQVAFSRASKSFVAFNRDDSNWSATLQTGLPAGVYCNIIGDVNADNATTCTNTVTVDSSGRASVYVYSKSAVAIHTGAKKA